MHPLQGKKNTKPQALNPNGKLDTIEVVFPGPIASKI